jgi:GGDEF domain-containing protein
MPPNFLVPQLLDPRHLPDFWRTLWVGTGIGIIASIPFANTGDWMRLGVLGLGIGMAHLVSLKRPVLGLCVFFTFMFLVSHWMLLDPTGVVSRFQAGVMGFGMIGMVTLIGMGLFLGSGGAVLGVLIGAAFLTQHLYAPQWPFALEQLVLGALIGSVMNTMLRNQQRTQAQLERAAVTDAMTGLENRRALAVGFERYAALTARQGEPLLVTVWDINDLKRVNDTHGHAAGDAYLQAFVDALHHGCRAGDALYRVGGDEFVGLHPGLEDGTLLRDRVLERFGSVAVGWTVAAGDLDATLQAADAMMYAAKAAQKSYGPVAVT